MKPSDMYIGENQEIRQAGPTIMDGHDSTGFCAGRKYSTQQGKSADLVTVTIKSGQVQEGDKGKRARATRQFLAIERFYGPTSLGSRTFHVC